LVVILAIINEGKLVTEGNKSVFKRIKLAGYVLIIFTIILNFYQYYSSERTLKETKELSRTKEIKDSVRIADLTLLAKTNLIKTDSVKVQLIDNAAKVFEDQQKSKERENENTFIHLQKETKENLNKLLIVFDEKNVRGYTDSTGMFIHSRFSVAYLEKYETISSKPVIIENFMKISEILKKINDYSDLLVQQTNIKDRRLTVNMIVKNTALCSDYLMNLFERIYNLHSYKEYESLNFSIDPVEFDREKLKQILSYEFSIESVEIEKDIDFTKAVIKNKKGATN
jgi:hypothetical protein